MSRTNHLTTTAVLSMLLLCLLGLAACLPQSPLESGSGISVTLYGFSVMKEPLEKAIYPAFAAKWKTEHGVDVHFTSSFAGSEMITNQILQGVKAQIGIFSIDRDPQRLKEDLIRREVHLIAAPLNIPGRCFRQRFGTASHSDAGWSAPVLPEK